MLNTAFGNSYLLNTLGLLSNFLPNMRNWHENTLLNNAFGISSVRARDTALVSSEPKSFWWYLQVVNSAQECGSLVDQHLLRSLTIELRDFLLVVILSHDDLNSPRPPWGKLNLWELCVDSYRTHSPLAPRASSLLLEANSISKSPRMSVSRIISSTSSSVSFSIKLVVTWINSSAK